MQNGRLSFVVWVLMLCAYIGTLFAKIDAPHLTDAFVAITGVLVGNLGLTQSKKVAHAAENAEKAAVEAAIVSEKVDRLTADVAEQHSVEGQDTHHPEAAGDPDA